MKLFIFFPNPPPQPCKSPPPPPSSSPATRPSSPYSFPATHPHCSGTPPSKDTNGPTLRAITLHLPASSLSDLLRSTSRQIWKIVVTEILSHIQECNEESKSMHKPEHLKSLRNKINSNTVSVLKKAKAITAQLEEMDRSNSVSRRVEGVRKGPYRLRKKLNELMMEFQGLRQRMKKHHHLRPNTNLQITTHQSASPPPPANRPPAHRKHLPLLQIASPTQIPPFMVRRV